MHVRIDNLQIITTYPTRERAEAAAETVRTADGLDDVLYVVEPNARGFFIAVNDAETGERIGTL